MCHLWAISEKLTQAIFKLHSQFIFSFYEPPAWGLTQRGSALKCYACLKKSVQGYV